jgi:hypothetical protein
MFKCMTLIFVLTFSVFVAQEPLSGQLPFRIISENHKGQETTDTIQSGVFTFGINGYGGGSISMVSIPGIGNIMGDRSLSYGRMGQSSIRSKAHGNVYNPTQAGFNEPCGTECSIEKTTGKMVVIPRGCTLWRADNKYDFTRWENVCNDSYDEIYKHGGAPGASDEDGLHEEDLEVVINGITYNKQEAELYSEFDYYGTYENYMGKNGIATPAIRHYFEYRFIRSPGHCLNQFRAGTLMWDEDEIIEDISVQYPKGVFRGTDKDMNFLTTSWSIRNDVAIWEPMYRHIQRLNGTWEITSRESILRRNSTQNKQVFIVAESADLNSGRAIGFYQPDTEINRFSVIGVRDSDGSVYYTDNRVTETFWNDQPYRIPTMSWMGFRNYSLGLINRDRLPEGIYEAYRQEFLVFYGTPQQIMDAIDTYDASVKMNQTITFLNLPEANMQDGNIVPEVTSNSGLPVSLSSSNTDVAIIVDSHIQIIGEGTAVITASQSGDDTYNAALDVSRTITVNPYATGIPDLTGSQIEIFPNPARDYVTIKVGSKPVHIEIVNLTGQTVYSASGVTDELQIPVWKLGGKGVYAVRVNTFVTKLVVGM